MVDPNRLGLSLVLGATLVLYSGGPVAGADDPKAPSPPASSARPQGAVPIPDSVQAHVDEARKAVDRNDWTTAERLYAEVLEKEPGLTSLRFEYASVLARGGKPAEAVLELDKAIGPEPSFEALLTAGVILQGRREDKATSHASQAASYFQRALDLAVSEQGLKNADALRLMYVAKLALQLQQTEHFNSALGELRARFPDAKETHYFGGIQAAMNEAWLNADDELARARALGMPMDGFSPASLQEIHGLAKPRRYAWYATYSVGAVTGGLVVLFLLGRLLSFLTLHSAETADPNLAITPLQRGLRSVYRLVINLAGLYYYICLPFVIVIAIGIVIGLAYLLFMLRQIPVKAILLLLGFGVAMLAMILSSIRSLFVRLKYEDPGRALTADEAPKLWEMTREVARAVDTRPVDAIFLTPGTELAVFERGNWLQRLRDQSKRSLILGLGVVDGFRIDDFRAVLAHEYGHFLHRDTAGGDVAMRVNATMSHFATAMATQGQLAWWNVGWQFVRLYHLIFRRITHGASRLQEINADRVAARLCGQKPFESGLRHVIRRDLVQNIEAGRTAFRMERIAATSTWKPKPGEDPVAPLLQLVEGKREVADDPWWDVYTRAENRRQVDRKIAEIWNAGSSEDDTHPTPAERVRLLSRLKPPESPRDGNGASAPEDRREKFLKDLFADPQALHAERTKQVTERVAAYVAQNRLGNLDAIDEINIYLAKDPDPSTPLQQRAKAKLALRDFAGAEADCCELIALEGQNPAAAYYLRGLARAALDKNDDAIADFREAISRDQSFACNGRIELGDAHMQAGRPEEAVDEYTQAIALAPDALNLYLRRGDAHTRAGRCAEAEADFTKALDLDPGSAEALALRALERAQAGRRDEAEADASAAMAIDPLIADAIPALGGLRVEWRQGGDC
jgi:tetratricopeptide (TPR) repeat protein